MLKHPDFDGFDEIKASSDLKRRLYALTKEHVNDQRTIKRYIKPTAIVASISICVLAVALAFQRIPSKNIDLIGSAPGSSSSTDHGTTAQPQISGEMLHLLAYSPLSHVPEEITLDGVQVTLPNLGPDYHTEIIDGKEVEVAGGFICPDLSVSGDGMVSVTYTAENELLMYEDPRQWVTEEGLPTWHEENRVVPTAFFADPYHPTTDEIVDALEGLRESGELLSLEQSIVKIKWAEDYYEHNGQPPSDEDYDELRKLYEELVSVPLDYSQFLIETEVDEEYSNVWIILKNPKNLIDSPNQWEHTVTTRPSEIVAYYYTDSTFDKMRIKGEHDLTGIHDVIKIDVLFESGSTKTIYLQVSHDADGVLSMRASDKI